MSERIPVNSSVEAVERVGSKLTPADFTDFLLRAADSFPIGSPEEEFLETATAADSSEVLSQSFMGLLEDKDDFQASDRFEHGFLWELLSPTDMGTSIFRKLEELDPASAENLYDLIAYTMMHSAPSLSSPDADESAVVTPEEGIDVATEAEAGKPEADTPGGDPVVDATAPGADPDKEKRKKETVMSAKDPAAVAATAPITSAAQAPAAAPTPAAPVGSTPITQTDKSDAGNWERTQNTVATTPELIKQWIQKWPIRTPILIARGFDKPMPATVIGHEANGIRVKYADGTTSVENPRYFRSANARQALNADTSAFLLVTSVKSSSGVTSFRMASFTKTSQSQIFRSVHPLAMSMSDADFVKSGLNMKSTVLFGARLRKVMSALDGVQGMIAESRVRSFRRTFITEKRAFAIRSSKTHLYAISAPVEFIANSRGYAMFRKIESTYISSTGHKFSAVLAAKYGRPEFLLVSNRSRKHFSNKSMVKASVFAAVDRKEALYSQRMLRAAIASAKKMVHSTTANVTALAQSLQKQTEIVKSREVTISQQSKQIVDLKQSVVAAKTAGQSVNSSPQAPVADAGLARFLSGRVGKM
jgi:hypothetical protein